MLAPPSPFQRFVHAAYYPIVALASLAAVLVPVQIVTDLISDANGKLAAAVLGAACAPLFLIAVFDRRTRDAVDQLNATLRLQWPTWTWRERLFAREYGDRALLVLNRILWLEIVASMFGDTAMSASLLGFAGFALTTVFFMLLLAYPRNGIPP